jgi:hypothetical protein
MATPRDAVDEQVAAAVRADVTQGHGLEGLGSPLARSGHPSGISAGQRAAKHCLPLEARPLRLDRCRTLATALRAGPKARSSGKPLPDQI